MVQAGNGKHRSRNEIRLYTLTEVAESINVSMPTAQRYKQAYQDRIPAVGLGRKQRYPREALRVFEQIKLENLGKRGRPSSRSREQVRTKSKPRKTPGSRSRTRSASSRRAAVPIKARQSDLLTLTEVSQRTGISYPTCINYVKKHLDRIPHVGSGRRRRYPPEAVTVFRELRNQSRSGRRKSPAARTNRTDKALMRRIRELEKAQRQLARQLEAVAKAVNAPLKVTIKRG